MNAHAATRLDREWSVGRASPCLRHVLLALVAMSVLTACARVDSRTEYRDTTRKESPKPERILVYDFAFSPEQVHVDSSLMAEASDTVSGDSERDEIDVGRQAAKALSEKLIEELQPYGIFAQRAKGRLSDKHNVVVIEGEFLSVDEGDVTNRSVIGFGYGASEVRARVQVFEVTSGRQVLLTRFRTEVASGRRPGMGPMAGAGAAAGSVGVSIAANAATGVAAETTETFLGADVEADLRHMAEEIAERVAQAYVRHGWLPRSVLDGQ